MARPFNPIDAPPASPPRLGLHASAVPLPQADRRWIDGITFEREVCRSDSDGWYWCPDEGEDPAEKEFEGCQTIVEYRPYVLVEGVQRSSFDDGDRQAQVRRQLIANQPQKMENELWSGAIATAAGFPNRVLASADADDITSPSGTTPLMYALHELQQYLAETVSGRGMIHATIRTVGFWMDNNALRREGNILLDLMDNIVVPGTGYDGSGPDGDIDTTGETNWAYATSMVYLIEDTINVKPGSLPEALDRGLNNVAWLAERAIATFFDLCAHAAINVDMCSPCCEPTGS